MLLLPPISWSQRLDEPPVRLPCPVDDWIGLIAGNDASVSQIVRSNPSVFLFACEGYQAETSKGLSQWSDLLRWSLARLAPRLIERYFAADGTPAIGTIVNTHGTSGAAKRWLKAKGDVDLNERLGEFLTCATGLDEKAIKIDHPTWLPTQLVMEAVRKRDVTGRLRRQQLVDRWTQGDRPEKIEQVLQLLRLKHQSLETAKHFADRLQLEKLESMKQLAYGASHEINNPLANIASRAQAMVQTETDLSRRQKLATIYEQAMRAHEMISDMMLFANPPRLRVRQTDLRLLIPAVIRDIEASLARQEAFHDKQIDFAVRLGPGLQPIEIDPDQISVLLHCLVKNSMEAIESKGSVDLDVRFQGRQQLQISVTDDGVGVTELAKRHLFDPFYSGREAGRGLGFGLSKAWRIAQLHGASLILDESHSPGARFVVTLPLGTDSCSDHNKSVQESSVRLADPKSHAA